MFTYPVGTLNPKVVSFRPGLVGEWLFKGNANDTSGYNNHGTVVGGATLVADHNGNPNSAYSFAGSPQSIVVGDFYDMHLSDWSISCRINTAFINTSGIIFKGPTSSTNNRYGIYTTSGNLGAFIQPGSALSASVAASSGTKSVVVTYDRDGLMTLFVDTVNVKTTNIAAGVAWDMDNADDLTFGGFSGGLYYTGTIDFVKIYDRVMTPEEITFDNSL